MFLLCEDGLYLLCEDDHGDVLYRYIGEDEFGQPETAFVICVFWYIDALAALGQGEEARRLFETMLTGRNPLGLLSEDIDSQTGEFWGNFPQSYSYGGTHQLRHAPQPELGGGFLERRHAPEERPSVG